MNNPMTIKNLSELVTPSEETEVVFNEGCLAGVSLHVKNTLTMKEAMDFIASVYTSCIDSETGEYIPESYDFSMRTNVVSYYCGIRGGKCDMNKVYALVYNTPIVSVVMSHIDVAQFNALESAIEKKIEYTNAMNASSATSKVIEMMEQVKGFTSAAAIMTDQMRSVDMDSIAEAAKRVNQMTDAYANAEDRRADNVIAIKKKKE